MLAGPARPPLALLTSLPKLLSAEGKAFVVCIRLSSCIAGSVGHGRTDGYPYVYPVLCRAWFGMYVLFSAGDGRGGTVDHCIESWYVGGKDEVGKP
jgi:hypothetical protein